MALSIINRSFGDVTERRVVLGAESLVRKLTIGTDWNSIVIGMRFIVNPNGNISSFLNNSRRLAFGLCSGPNGWTKTPANWVGLSVAPAAHTYNAGPPAYYSLSAASNLGMVRRVGATITSIATTSNTNYWHASPELLRNIWVLQITKGVPNWAVINYPNTTSPPDGTSALLDQAMETPGVSFVTGYGGTTFTIASNLDETPGSLDHVNVAWLISSRLLEVDEIRWRKLS
jgi:hypothetical protein